VENFNIINKEYLQMSEEQTNHGGVENELNGVGIFYFIISIISFVILIVLAKDAAEGVKPLFIVAGVVCLIQGIILWILFRAGGEVIRLLKKLNGLPFGGTISGVSEERKIYNCTECGEPTILEAKYCTNCGVSFDATKGAEVHQN
jgi:hypothetical protein